MKDYREATDFNKRKAIKRASADRERFVWKGGKAAAQMSGRQ
jgi:hypothetical protein